MNKVQRELVVSLSVLPVIADYLEDQPFSKLTKMKANVLINMIRSFDNHIMNSASPQVVEEQHSIGLWFRNEVKKSAYGVKDTE